MVGDRERSRAIVDVRRFDLTSSTTDRSADDRPTDEQKVLKQAKFNIINLSCARYTVGSNDTRKKNERRNFVTDETQLSINRCGVYVLF